MPRRFRLPMIADEFDALTKWRHWLHWRAGERARIKRGYRRRERRVLKQKIRKEDADGR